MHRKALGTGYVVRKMVEMLSEKRLVICVPRYPRKVSRKGDWGAAEQLRTEKKARARTWTRRERNCAPFTFPGRIPLMGYKVNITARFVRYK